MVAAYLRAVLTEAGHAVGVDSVTEGAIRLRVDGHPLDWELHPFGFCLRGDWPRDIQAQHGRAEWLRIESWCSPVAVDRLRRHLETFDVLEVSPRGDRP